mmetsp:Transcript_6272/g.15119  ORF Transcript_6272/g.15119 Transcript_6272/m.15119 type:complete len:678 (-) Transcript_6272:414-2447(-)
MRRHGENRRRWSGSQGGRGGGSRGPPRSSYNVDSGPGFDSPRFDRDGRGGRGGRGRGGRGGRGGYRRPPGPTSSGEFQATHVSSTQQHYQQSLAPPPSQPPMKPASQRATTTKRWTAVALFNFEPREADELPLKEGDKVIVESKHDTDDWWEGGCNGKSGCFPMNFVKVLGEYVEFDSSSPKKEPPPQAPVQQMESRDRKQPRNRDPPPHSSSMPYMGSATSSRMQRDGRRASNDFRGGRDSDRRAGPYSDYRDPEHDNRREFGYGRQFDRNPDSHQPRDRFNSNGSREGRGGGRYRRNRSASPPPPDGGGGFYRHRSRSPPRDGYPRRDDVLPFNQHHPGDRRRQPFRDQSKKGYRDDREDRDRRRDRSEPYGSRQDRRDSFVLYISNLHQNEWTPDLLHNLFSGYGDVLKIKITYKNRSVALVEMGSKYDAERTRKLLNESTKIFGKMLHVNASNKNFVKVSEHETEPGYVQLSKDYTNTEVRQRMLRISKNSSRKRAAAPQRVLFVYGVYDGCTDEDILQHFKTFEPQAVHRKPHQPRIAHILFSDSDQATRALVYRHDTEFPKGSKTRLQVRYSDKEVRVFGAKGSEDRRNHRRYSENPSDVYDRKQDHKRQAGLRTRDTTHPPPGARNRQPNPPASAVPPGGTPGTRQESEQAQDRSMPPSGLPPVQSRTTR